MTILSFDNYLAEKEIKDTNDSINYLIYKLSEYLDSQEAQQMITEAKKSQEYYDDLLKKSPGVQKAKEKREETNKHRQEKSQQQKELEANKTNKEPEDKRQKQEVEDQVPEVEVPQDKKTQDAKQWYDQIIGKDNTPRKSKSETLKNYRKTNSILLGRVYAYRYDPKHKATLPFFDSNPLVIPFEFKNGVSSKGFVGVNLHFVPRYQRKAVMQFFIKMNPDQVMKKGELPINYDVNIKNNSRYPYLKHCVRMYLLNHIMGGAYMIPQEDYVKIIDLYSGEYVGMSEQQIVNYIKNLEVKSLYKSMKKKKEEPKKPEQQKTMVKKQPEKPKYVPKENPDAIKPIAKATKKKEIKPLGDNNGKSKIEPLVQNETQKQITEI